MKYIGNPFDEMRTTYLSSNSRPVCYRSSKNKVTSSTSGYRSNVIYSSNRNGHNHGRQKPNRKDPNHEPPPTSPPSSHPLHPPVSDNEKYWSASVGRCWFIGRDSGGVWEMRGSVQLPIAVVRSLATAQLGLDRLCISIGRSISSHSEYHKKYSAGSATIAGYQIGMGRTLLPIYPHEKIWWGLNKSTLQAEFVTIWVECIHSHCTVFHKIIYEWSGDLWK